MECRLLRHKGGSRYQGFARAQYLDDFRLSVGIKLTLKTFIALVVPKLTLLPVSDKRLEKVLYPVDLAGKTRARAVDLFTSASSFTLVLGFVCFAFHLTENSFTCASGYVTRRKQGLRSELV